MRTPEYRAYWNAKNRCRNQSARRYKDYGGRGIQFLFKSFAQFMRVVGPRPSPQHSIDRVNNDGHYEPGNVRWATRLEQMNNRRPKQKGSTKAPDRHLPQNCHLCGRSLQDELVIHTKHDNHICILCYIKQP